MEKRNKMRGRILALVSVLVLGILVLSGCQSGAKEYTVTFNTCTNLETNKVKDRTVQAGKTVSKPNVYMSDEEYSSYLVAGWYTDAEYTTEWNFDTDVVESDMVLYAKWEKQYFVTYYVSNMIEPPLGVYVKEGECAPKQDYIRLGYKVEGYYADAGYSIPFDFTKPLTQDTDIFIRLSDSLYWDAKAISEHFYVHQASGDTSTLGSITYEENGDEDYVRVDFGYCELPDARIAVAPDLDMTKSQILTMKYKNLGNTPGLRIFWTVKYEDGTVSGQEGETPEERTWDFGEVEIQSGMSEDDDWATLTIDMGKLSIINGASQWANGKILGMIRFDSLYYAAMDEEYVDNIMLIKEISFAPGEDYAASDSVQIEADDVFEVMEAADAQESVSKGYVFPKDAAESTPKQGTLQYNMTDCITYLFPYGTKQGLVSYDMSDMNIDLDTNNMLYLRYKNEGHGSRLTVRYHTTDGKTGEQTLDIKKTMNNFSLLAVNMMNDEDWTGKLESIDLIYHKKDTNNVLSIESIYLKPFEARQIPGINFVDDKCAGFASNDDYKIVYDSKSEASYLEMLTDEVMLQKKVSIDTSSYSTVTFEYSVPTAGVKRIELAYQIGGKWYTETIDDVKRTSGFETATFTLQKKGIATKMYVKLIGRGKLSIRAFQFNLDQDYSLDFSTGDYISDHFLAEWAVGYDVDYDAVKGAAILTGGGLPEARCMFYLGASGFMNNIHLDAASRKVYVCYNNPGNARTATLNVFYAGSENLTGSGVAGNDVTVKETKAVAATAQLKGNMKEGEWAVAVFDFSELGLFSADRNATMLAFAPGGDIYLRSIVLR